MSEKRATEYKHIVVDSDQTPFIDGTTLKVKELALEYLSYGWSAEQLQRQHDYLSLAQIHGALSYYFDHQSVMDKEIFQELSKIDEIASLDPILKSKLESHLRKK
ncbi:MAG: DUF433 domain-containing protein [Candidatus Obscuribacterales bacterium]|nr:DUF433 domain-containing protein [Candidatus Obscuribacterales bacterium]